LIDRRLGQQHFDGEGIAQHVRMGVGQASRLEDSCQGRPPADAGEVMSLVPFQKK